jgi:hypothetical protein
MSKPAETGSWTLCHAWHSASDRAALALCAEELAKVGLEFHQSSEATGADAVKMHGCELLDALDEGTLRPVDLGRVADAQAWQSRVDPRAWRFMRHGRRIHGIPMALHQSNCLWANAALAASLERESPGRGGDLPGWLRAAGRRAPKPLAIGSEPWQVGILFESLCLTVMGTQTYSQAFERLEPDALGGSAMVEALELLIEARAFVDDARLNLPWRSRLDDIGSGEAAVMAMGDWVGAAMPSGVERLRIDGFDERSIFIADFFVPVGEQRPEASLRAASALTSADFQARMAEVKGSCAPILEAQGPGCKSIGTDAPSLTFDQCCNVRTKLALLDIVADHFLNRRSPAVTAAALAAIGLAGP